MRSALSLLVALLAFQAVCGQLKLDQGYYARVIAPTDVTYSVQNPYIIIDTLVMDDDSELTFELPNTTLEIRYAVIGKKCKWNASGKPGAAAGEPGGDGGNIQVTAVFEKLDQLTIDARGGTGSKGLTGMQGRIGRGNWSGGPGGNGGPGGDGGHAGNITLNYRCNGFSPVFEKEGQHSIVLKARGGDGGTGGTGGNGGISGTNQARKGRKGETGPAGNMGRPGLVTLNEIQN